MHQTMSNPERILHHVTHGILLLFCSIFGTTSFAEDIFRAQGELAGEVSANSVILQTRLTSVDRNVDGDVPGAVGVARFEYATSRSFEKSQLTPWNSSRAKSDYIVSNSRWKVSRRRQGFHFFRRVIVDRFSVQIASHNGKNRQLAQIERI